MGAQRVGDLAVLKVSCSKFEFRRRSEKNERANVAICIARQPVLPFYGGQKQWLNGPRVTARFYVESNDPSGISNISAGRVERPASSSILTNYRNYHINPSSHSYYPNRVARFRIASDDASPSCWFVEFECQLHAYDGENH
jgi:hypothetical protein